MRRFAPSEGDAAKQAFGSGTSSRVPSSSYSLTVTCRAGALPRGTDSMRPRASRTPTVGMGRLALVAERLGDELVHGPAGQVVAGSVLDPARVDVQELAVGAVVGEALRDAHRQPAVGQAVEPVVDLLRYAPERIGGAAAVAVR